MDTFCGIGLPELIIIALVGFVLIGPERTRELALQGGRMLRRVMKSPWWREFTQVTDAMRNLPTTLVRMAELEEVQAELQRELRDIDAQTRVNIDMDFGDSRTGKPPASAATNPWDIPVPEESSAAPPETAGAPVEEPPVEEPPVEQPPGDEAPPVEAPPEAPLPPEAETPSPEDDEDGV